MCFLSLPQLHYSLAEPLACELAPKFRQDNLLEGQVVAAALACLTADFQPAVEFVLSTNKEPCGVTCFLALYKAGIRASPSLICTAVYYDYSPPVVRCFLMLGLSNATLLLTLLWQFLHTVKMCFLQLLFLVSTSASPAPCLPSSLQSSG